MSVTFLATETTAHWSCPRPSRSTAFHLATRITAYTKFQLSKTPVRRCVGVKQGPPLSTLLINAVKLTSSSAAAFSVSTSRFVIPPHLAVGRLAVGRLTVGRLTVGRLAVGRFAVGRLVVGISPSAFSVSTSRFVIPPVRLGHQPVRPSGTERALLMMDPAEVGADGLGVLVHGVWLAAAAAAAAYSRNYQLL
ncbi:hypothetical protein VOLCADRAFT_98894 [Volvox carteri f. nagariensis]|uniref:Uncharacterized protein n=1 Tax=Volvox carteri f. nagariensis TaxID=3068 RepID=D8UGJ3_VOLCA|nr:uncharacterized protein VOLCADRAFT_98894 [Volvox carteri f. nagariensis]EFJ41183.1 hypothetical protein VOLCADRAFT_98894 [Volvox carteri f. nagariensis]|eukprot:XP_002957751.1 hypothetical protein VOLCADRAFT_98894 [Volvox carteri f. nagariensis]